MRIQPDQAALQLSETAQSPAQNPSAQSASSTANSSLSQDLAQLSSGHAQIQALAAQVAQLPEVRAEKVSALRQAVQSGVYRPSPDEVAGAVFSHMILDQAA